MIFEGKTNNSILFIVCTMNKSVLKIYIFFNSYITKTFRMSFFSLKSYQRDSEIDVLFTSRRLLSLKLNYNCSNS